MLAAHPLGRLPAFIGGWLDLVEQDCARIQAKGAKAMTIEIQKPELEALILERMQKGGFASIEDALMQAMEAAPMVAEHQGKSCDGRTGTDLIAALQASPYRELDIEPPRFRSSAAWTPTIINPSNA